MNDKALALAWYSGHFFLHLKLYLTRLRKHQNNTKNDLYSLCLRLINSKQYTEMSTEGIWLKKVMEINRITIQHFKLFLLKLPLTSVPHFS